MRFFKRHLARGLLLLAILLPATAFAQIATVDTRNAPFTAYGSSTSIGGGSVFNNMEVRGRTAWNIRGVYRTTYGLSKLPERVMQQCYASAYLAPKCLTSLKKQTESFQSIIGATDRRGAVGSL